MPVPRYGVLKGRVFARRTEPDDLATPHFHLAVSSAATADTLHAATPALFRIAINVRARDGIVESDHHLRFAARRLPSDWNARLFALDDGFTTLDGEEGLDYVRHGLVMPDDFVRLAPSLPGPSNDLNEMLDSYVGRAIARRAKICAFGSLFGPIPQSDPYFGWTPSQGMHNVHRNQGSPLSGPFGHDNGVYTDGALFVETGKAWVGLFLQFGTQQWHTNDRTGYPL